MARGDPLRFELDDDDLKLFSEEAEEQLQLLDTAIVQLEGEPDPELVQSIFRAAHTLKGSSATIGHRTMASLTHAMESVLDAVRQGHLQPSADVVDRLLAALDALRVLAKEVVTRVDSGTETADLEAALMALLAERPAELSHLPPAPQRAAAPSPVLPGGGTGFRVTVDIDRDCQMPGIRCYQALQELDALALVASLDPSREVLEAGNGDWRFTAVVSADATPEQLAAGLEAVPDVRARIEPYAAPEPSPEPEPADVPTRPKLSVVESGNSRPAPRRASQSVRIDVERLDGLMNLVGELVIDRTRLQQIKDRLSDVLRDTELAQLTEHLEETTAHLARITDELQEEIMRSRMLPVRAVLTRLPRLVRDVAAKCGKKVELVTTGEETELDRSVIEEISDPLVHILRNAVDHGIESPDERLRAGKPETGVVTVTAWNQETYIYIAVRDDGRGIDTRRLREKAVERGLIPREAAEAASDEAAVQYIFLPGLSTAAQVSDVSGRGVGMDIVRTNIERLNGSVTVRSTPGEGSEFVIQLPLTLATTKALMVQANGTVYAMPLVSVTEALTEADADIHLVGGQRTLRLRGQLLPVTELAAALGDHRPSAADPGSRFVVAARHGDRQIAFIVDRLLGEQDVVVKSLGEVIGNRRGLSGATILGDGTLGLIIDIASLAADHAAFRASA
ncbi:MAG: chemotaxis protein CheA [Hyphomicrobiales bacterium]